MSTDDTIKRDSYFNARNVSAGSYTNFELPQYLASNIPADKNITVLDIGCGLGQMLSKLKEQGYKRLKGIDISNESITFCREKGLDVDQITDIIDYARDSAVKYDCIIMSHVLEHIEKSKIIDTLISIKTKLLSDKGIFLLMVPNAQSNTGAYWMYEDFTHTTLFTAGSALYVLKSAGFTHIEFINADGTAYLPFYKKIPVKILLWLYRKKQDFWNRMTQSSFHKPSPRIYSFELKIKAS